MVFCCLFFVVSSVYCCYDVSRLACGYDGDYDVIYYFFFIDAPPTAPVTHAFVDFMVFYS